MESYHVPHGPKNGIWFADQAGFDQFIEIAKRDKDLGPEVTALQAQMLLAGTGITLTPAIGPGNTPMHIATEDDLTILRSGMAAIIDCWNYGVDSPVAAARKPDLDRITAAMFRRQERAAKKMKRKA